MEENETEEERNKRVLAALTKALEEGKYDAAPDPHGLQQGTCKFCIAEGKYKNDPQL